MRKLLDCELSWIYGFDRIHPRISFLREMHTNLASQYAGKGYHEQALRHFEMAEGYLRDETIWISREDSK